MRSSKRWLLGICAFALVAGSGAALASHGKVGLWEVSITMGGDQKMPDISKAPPEVQARMRAMGMSANGNALTAQHCMTTAEVANDSLPTAAQNKDCTFSNMKTGGGVMSADLTCKGQFTGTGHMQFTYDSATHYSGEMTMQGVADGHPMKQEQKFEGHWLSADCGGVTH